MNTSRNQTSAPEWALNLGCFDRPRALTASHRGQAGSAEVDEDGLAAVLAEIVRGLLQRSPLAMDADLCEAPTLTLVFPGATA